MDTHKNFGLLPDPDTPDIDRLEKKSIRGFCIICREDGKEMSDEHLIPYALGGRYHVYNVCEECNRKFGEFVDKPLTDHWLMVAERHTHHLKGHSGKIPNPLTGEGILTCTGEKVKVVENNEGQVEVRLIPRKPTVNTEIITDASGNPTKKLNISFLVDCHDEKLIPKAISTILRKNKISSDSIPIHHKRIVNEIQNPEVQMHFQMDLHKFKMGFLKMTYEFTCDKLPEYVNDPDAIKISGILHSHDFDRLQEVTMMGDGFSDFFLQGVLSRLINLSNPKRHYLILLPCDGKLSCIVNLFGKFSIGFIMADREYLNSTEGMLITINDFENFTVVHYTLDEISRMTFAGVSRAFTFDNNGNALMASIPKGLPIGFAANIYGHNILYDCHGIPITTDREYIRQFDPDKVIETILSPTETKYEYPLPTGMYVNVHTPIIISPPLSLLIPVATIVEVERRKPI